MNPATGLKLNKNPRESCLYLSPACKFRSQPSLCLPQFLPAAQTFAPNAPKRINPTPPPGRSCSNLCKWSCPPCTPNSPPPASPPLPHTMGNTPCTKGLPESASSSEQSTITGSLTAAPHLKTRVQSSPPNTGISTSLPLVAKNTNTEGDSPLSHFMQANSLD